MTYEITNMDLHLMYRDRPCRGLRRRDSAIVWPARPGAVPEIPFNPYPRRASLYDTFRDADEANERFGKLVQQGFMPPRRDRGQADSHGKRATPGRQGPDLCDVDHWEAREAALARREACKNHFCPEYFARSRGCLDRQRAGMCPAQSGCDMRSDTSRVQGSGRKPA